MYIMISLWLLTGYYLIKIDIAAHKCLQEKVMIIGMLLLLVVIQCRLASHPVQMSLSFSTNGFLIQYQWKETNKPLKYNVLRC